LGELAGGLGGKTENRVFFFPYRLDVALYRIPFFTVIVCLVCITTFLSQIRSSHTFHDRLSDYCAHETSVELHAMLNALRDEEFGHGCANVLLGIREAGDKDAAIARLANEGSLEFYRDRQQDVAYKQSLLHYGYDEFLTLVPKDLTHKLAYRPDGYDVWAMLTSVFAHASWDHLIGNLIFFFIFASCVECALGYAAFVGTIVLMAVVTSLAYAHSVAGGEALPTIGLSGIAMGMMALLTTLLPRAKIWCFFWFFFFFRRFTLPVLLIALWHIGWNVYDLKHMQAGDNINYMAHVSGAALGITLGILFRLFAPRRLDELEMAMGG